MSKWTKTTLGKIADIITGPFGSQLHQSDYVKRGIPIVMPQDIGNRNINYSSINYVSEEDATRLKRYSTVANDILYARRGDVEKHAFVRAKDACVLCGTGCLRVRINSNEVEPAFLSFYLNREETRKWLVTHAVGTNMPNLNTDILSDVPIAYPTLKEQRKIVKVLNCLEERIVLNEKINDNLAYQLKDIYNYWFNQFDFPHNDKHQYKTDGGLMIWNDKIKRKIPASWEIKSFGELCSLRNGINYDKSVEGEKMYKIINVRNISSSDLILNENDFDEISLPQKQGNKYRVSDNSIIVARSGIPGATRILQKPSGNIIFCGFIICCTPCDDIYKYYLMFYLKQLEGSAATKTGGSILQNVSQDTLSDLLVPIPPQSLLRKFNQIVSQSLELIHSNMQENTQLLKLRDWLLPMLMNGQATISD